MILVRKIFFHLFSLIVLSTSQVFAFQITLEEVLVIGEKNPENSAFIFSGITNIKVLSNSNIIVSDLSDNSIRVFTEDGDFIKRIGRRGRGPGEFQHISSIFIDSNNRIQVLDRFQNRISIFDINGNLLATVKLQNVPVGTSIFMSQDNSSENYLIGYRDYRNNKDHFLLHEFDSDFNNKLNQHVDVFEYFFNSGDKMEAQISQRPAYLATHFSENYLAMTPDIYTGNLLVFDKKLSKEQLIGDPISDYLVQYNWNDREKIRASGETGFASSSNQSGRFFYKQKGGNFGLIANDKFLLQFYALSSGKKITPYVKVYNTNLELIKTISLQKESDLYFNGNRISGIPYFLDDKNRIYISDHSYNGSYPAVRVFETSLNKLIEN